MREEKVGVVVDRLEVVAEEHKKVVTEGGARGGEEAAGGSGEDLVTYIRGGSDGE